MRRARKTRSQLNVSLFPFLAVLICTLGVLIVMLVMAAQSADQTAQSQRKEQEQTVQRQVRELQAQRDLLQIRFEGLKKMRPQLRQRLAQSRNNRSRLADQIRELESELAAARDRQQRAREAIGQPIESDDRVEFDAEAAEAQLATLESEIANVTASIQEFREQQQQVSSPRFLIVPHRGGGGTFRRPIFLECTADTIKLQPLGISISQADLMRPLSPGNPLDAALLTIREYWRRYDLAGDEGNPYPLLVVRPDGAGTFALARRAMKSWDDEFGYELVEAAKPLEFGESDPQLIREVRRSVDDAMARQRALAKRQQWLIQQAGYAGTGSAPGGVAGGGRAGAPGDASAAGHVAGQGDPGRLPSSESVRRQGARAAMGSGAGAAGQDSATADAWSSTNLDQETRQRLSRIADGTTLARVDADAAADGPPAGSSSRAGSGGPAQASGGDGNAAGASSGGDQSLAQQRGQNWALPTRTAGAVGYLRPIRIVCSPQGLTMMTAGGEPKTTGFSPTTRSAVDPLVDEIWKRIDTWGIAGTGNYWKPQLRVTIQPGAEARFKELQQLLEGSGLDVRGEQP